MTGKKRRARRGTVKWILLALAVAGLLAAGRLLPVASWVTL